MLTNGSCVLNRRVIIDEDEVRRLWVEENLSIKQIAKTLGVPRCAVRIEKILIGQGNDFYCWCGIKRKDHVRCFGCGILIGPKHVAETAEWFLDRQYCIDCLKARRKLQCSECGAYQILYDHEIECCNGFGSLIIKGICYSCGVPNEFVNRKSVRLGSMN